jgi:hypothetical protein
LATNIRNMICMIAPFTQTSIFTCSRHYVLFCREPHFSEG